MAEFDRLQDPIALRAFGFSLRIEEHILQYLKLT
jgi:hypothetical protein